MVLPPSIPVARSLCSAWRVDAAVKRPIKKSDLSARHRVTKRYAPATERNRAPLLAVLQSQLPEQGVVLEIAAGSGQHAAYFAPHARS